MVHWINDNDKMGNKGEKKTMKTKKLTKEQINEIKERRNKGENIRELAIRFKVSQSTICYHLDKERNRRTYKKWYDSLSKEKKRKIFYNKERMSEYQRNRYRTDPDYREYKKNKVKEWRQKKSNSKPIEEVKGGKQHE